MIIQEIINKCKSDKVFISLVIVLVGIGSFGLGRLSKIEALRQSVSIEAPTQMANVVMAEKTPINAKITPKNDVNTTGIGQINPITSDTSSGQVVASKNGTKYHYPWCSGAKTISEANKIYFNSTEEARAAGYTPASNCKGLK